MNYENERYRVMKSQIESFYLIPVDKIVDSITEKISDVEMETSLLLETIFQSVFNGTLLYNDFLAPDTMNTFFNENIHHEGIRGIQQLLYIALQNNCILNAFFNELAFKSLDFKKPNSEEPDSKITAAKEPSITKLIFDTVNKQIGYSNLPGEARSQFFESRNRAFKPIMESSEMSYAADILKSLNNAADKTPSALPVTTSLYLAPTANFLFTHDNCVKFSRLLRDNRDIIKKYNQIWTDYSPCKAQYISNIDKLIFESEINAVFGFNFFNSISAYIESIHELPLSAGKSVKDLEGHPFLNIILQAANLSMFFNKELFLKYACCAFLNSPQTDFTYFEESANAVITKISHNLSNQQQVLNGLNLMRRFFQILDSVTLPLLFSLWEVVIYELNTKGNLPIIGMDTYEKYLSENYASISYSYCHLPDAVIHELGDHRFTFNNRINNALIKGYAAEYPYTYTETIYKDKKVQCIIPADVSKYTSESINYLLKSYCDIRPLKEKRAPLFFCSRGELAGYSPLSKLISSLLYAENSSGNQAAREKEVFLKKRQRNLYEYLSYIE
ncbi:MAG: hypothetical protein NC313_16600 [Butyrivibrio sp.]|nr:hypothetical protein [Butyrivibrio sp.]